MECWQSFFSTLIWQIIVVAVLVAFRKELSQLLARLASVRYGDTEFVFQAQTSEALDPVENKALVIRDEEGFFTNDGIRELVQDSQYLSSNEIIYEVMIVFRTLRQRTWLVFTNEQVFFLLDDEDTRASQRIIQYRQKLEESLPVTTHKESDLSGSGAFQLGKSSYWYYSLDILGGPTPARLRLERFIYKAGG